MPGNQGCCRQHFQMHLNLNSAWAYFHKSISFVNDCYIIMNDFDIKIVYSYIVHRNDKIIIWKTNSEIKF